MTLFVTGGAGFIGGNFIHYYLAEYPDDRVMCIDKLTYASNLSTLTPVMDNHNFRFCKLDICDRDGVFALFEDEKPDAVINFAAESHVDRSIRGISIYEGFWKRKNIHLSKITIPQT
ncbi:MAG: GDP-mannose 4,6-dehydratase [Lachnospiraceae bacterium]|nr:GDP-mannose 4,6-dehydratase [Lachnospiraceae bacterium]